MDFAPFENVVAWPALAGYLNFAEGRPDPRFQKQLSDLYAHCAAGAAPRPWELVHAALEAGLLHLHGQGTSAFADISQAQAVIAAAFDDVLPAYRKHHRDLLVHLDDAELWQPFLLARVFEAVLQQRGPWEERERVVAGALKQLNDYLGHRPIAVVENRRRGEPYDHERLRPIPLYLRGAGVAWGRYHDLVAGALALLEGADAAVLHDACLDVKLLDELALDPRAYDFNHPADKRPNYVFGEWDPHHLDNQARYRRFVVRQITLEALWRRVETETTLPRGELLAEAAAVLAGTMLMAAGVSGAGPSTHDSSVTLATLVPRIAKYRERFYAGLLDRLEGAHAERLRQEAALMRQPFAAARQALNHVLAQERALQLQRRRLALFFAAIGDPAASRRQLNHLPVASARLLAEMHIHLTTGNLLVERGRLAEAAQRLPQIEDLLRRGIACGALVDPWNVLGFSGQYPRFQALEDSVRDHRVDELTQVVEALFDLYARVLSEGAAAGTFAPGAKLGKEMGRLAAWWDRFATTTIADVAHVFGEEATASAEHVASVLSRWRERGAAAADLAFWREQIEGFRSAKAFALVVEALLGQDDHRAAMSLLMTWVSQADAVPLEEGDFSFHALCLRWMLSLCPAPDEESSVLPRADAANLAVKFFDYLEANADELWGVPSLDVLGAGGGPSKSKKSDEDEDSLYSAAYEDMTYRDSTDDDVEAEVLDVMPQKDFDLDHEAERLEKRLRFLATAAKLWNLATRIVRAAPPEQGAPARAAAAGWLPVARPHYQSLLELLDTIHAHDIPRPTSAIDAMMEYDRRLQTKQRLVSMVILTCLDHALAIGALRGLAEEAGAGGKGPPWEPTILALHRALMRQDVEAARALVPRLREQFRDEPLLYTPLHQGGEPRHILRAHIAQTILRGLVVNLPRQGLLGETYQLLRLARSIEAGQTLKGPRATEFDRLFQLGLHAVVESVIDAARRQELTPERVLAALQVVVEPFLVLWRDHSRDLRVSMLEIVQRDEDFQRLVDFIRRYGHDLFNARFLTPANLRALLQRGIGAWLDDLREDADPLHPVRLVEELGRRLPRAEAERILHLIINTLLENYDHLRDYNQTTTQSDYGENLYQLFEFLRLKASHDRAAWQFRPLLVVHEVLARQHPQSAALWRTMAQQITRQVADKLEQELRALEKKHGMRLVTIAQRFEERFVKPMELDRLVALVDPAVEEAAERFEREAPGDLEKAVEPLAQVPGGVGLDAPPWIVRLEQELNRVETAKSALVTLAETLLQVPRVEAPFEQVVKQFENWEQWTRD